jgi:16S rRNA (uracil1498-N3)-methyltransferase
LGGAAADAAVSVHRFLVRAIDRAEVEFSAAQAHQIGTVLRLRSGDRVRAFDGVTPWDVLVELSSPGIGRVVDRAPQRPEPRAAITAYLALLRRDKFELALHKLTELGVQTIVPMLTTRAVVREAPDARRLERWQAIAREATEQCGRGRLTVIRPLLTFDAVLTSAPANGIALMAYEEERTLDIRHALRNSRPDDVSILIGPEGGFSQQEAEQARKASVRLVTLGPRVLRAETAAPVFAALVLYELGDLSSWPA